MTTEMGPRAVLREDTIPFLEALKASVSSEFAHQCASAQPGGKLEHTGLDAHLDLLLSTHTFGYPKEDQRLWHAVAEATGLKAERTLFIDDSEAILELPRNLVFVTASA